MLKNTNFIIGFMSSIIVALKYVIVFLIGLFVGRIVMALQYAVMRSNTNFTKSRKN